MYHNKFQLIFEYKWHIIISFHKAFIHFLRIAYNYLRFLY